MNNIMKAQQFLLKKKRITIIILLIISFGMVFWGAVKIDGVSITGLQPLSVHYLASSSTYMVLLTGMLPIVVISFSYIKRIQMYEIMAGFSPNQIILGKTLCYLSYLIPLFLIPVTIAYLGCDRSAEMVKMLLLYWILCLRFSLCTIFLSPLLKELTVVSAFSFMVIIVMSLYAEIYGSNEEFSHSIFSLTCFAQCSLMTGEITHGFMAKVILSAMVACVISDMIGYLTLKKKIDLEPHPLS